jgi:hypothetical protein
VIEDNNVWDFVALPDGSRAQVTSRLVDACGIVSFVCKWHVGSDLHMATLERSDLTHLEA